jgi:DNA-3-methyladenine glycosylase II
MRRAFAVAGPPAVRRRRPGFAALLRIVVDQQISNAAGAAIFGRLAGAFRPLTAAKVAKASAGRLGALGLSRAKARCARALARAVAAGDLDLGRVADASDEEARAALMEIPGVGRWTADVYLLFALRRADAWPAGDLALSVAVQRLLGLPERPGAREMETLAESWRPYRGAAAHLLWAYYRKT